MALPNSEKITSQIAMLPDAALKQMAMMHKNDPYVLPLIISEDGRRKQMRQAAQAQMAGQPQSRVADAAVAQMGMLPEEQGIGQLPAPNIQRMADGGIAGFDESSNSPMSRTNLDGMGNTDGMFNYAHDGGGVVRMASGGMPKYAGKGEQLVRTTDGGKTWFLDIPSASRGKPSAAAALANQKFSSRQEAIAAFDALENTGTAEPQPVWGMGMPMNVGMPAGTDVSTLKQPAYVPPVAAPVASDAPAASAASAPKIPAEKPVASGGNAGQGIKAMYEQFAGDQNKRDTELNQIQERVRQQGEAETSAAQRQLDQLKTDLAAQGEYGKDKETKLKAKEERIGKEEGQAGGLALLEAGLAMMSGTSQNAFANIGQGAMVGTAAYRKSMDKIADAKDKLDDAYGRLEDVRFNQKNMNNSEIRKATADVDKAANAGLKSLTDYAITRYGLNDATAKTMFTGAIQERVANIGAGATMYAADKRSKDQSEYLQAIRGSGAIEQARKNVMEQVMKANKYGTTEELQTAFEKEWEKTLQLNPALAKLAGTSGGGSAVDTTGFKVLR